ncbi:MAG: RdgB/HAM1 family non-canonical purine NTP pyrophosphatase [Bacteroidales bacterium]|nr:RdgB/HAM1 family non-canonical purine NTP pyrophosphatase [Bacteroidales bacterium]
MTTLVFATGNRGKLREAAEILGDGYRILSPADVGVTDEPEETGSTFRENSLIKAEALWKATGLDCFADDSGLCVDALGGAPGIYSARYGAMAGFCADHDFEANIDRLLSEMDGIGDRRAHFHCTVTLITAGGRAFFDGECPGSIALSRSGDGGFGYDPVFVPDGFGCSMASLGEDVKNDIAHRGKALRLMKAFLESR